VTFEYLNGIPSGTPLTQNTLDQVCTRCFLKFLVAASVIGGASASDTLLAVFEFGLLCLKDTYQGTQVYCALEAQTFFAGLATPTTQSFVTTLDAACRTKCLVKYFLVAESIVGSLADAANSSRLFAYLCTKNPQHNNDYCLSLITLPSGNPCPNMPTDCSGTCQTFVSGAITSGGCCFTSALKFLLIAQGTADAFLPIVEAAVALRCSVTVPDACPTTNWDTVAVILNIANVRVSEYLAARQAFRDAIVKDLCIHLGCDPSSTTVTSDTTNAGSNSVTINISFSSDNGSNTVSGFTATDVSLSNTNSAGGLGGSADMTQPMQVSSGSAASSSPAKTSAATTVVPAIFLAMLALLAMLLL